MSSRMKFEMLLALASVLVALVGAILVQPVILGLSAVGALVATIMRLSDAPRSARRYTA